MTPIEIATRAAYENWMNGFGETEPNWNDIFKDHRDRLVESQRAALLALADADIFANHSEAGADELSADPTFNDQINAISAFGAILRSIANEGKENG